MLIDTTGLRTALVTGISGQDGHYLTQLLVGVGVTVHGVAGSTAGPGRRVIAPGVVVHGVRLADPVAVRGLLAEVAPDMVFHLAGMSSVAGSWAASGDAVRVNGLSTTTLLDACLHEQERRGRRIAFVNASSGEIFAGSGRSPQDESTPLSPTSPYGASKALGHSMCQIYRSRGLAASNAILYNHESPRRPAHFVTRKITLGVAAIVRGEADEITLGNTAVRRDFGWAPDYVDAMYRIAARGAGGGDFVIATGVSHSIDQFAEAAFAAAGIDDWRDRIRRDTALLRPTEFADMIGDASRAADVLGWRPQTTFAEIAAKMVAHDLAAAPQPASALGGQP